MENRRKFLTNTLTGLAALTLLPAVNTFAGEKIISRGAASKLKLRFALASDIHYGQKGTEYKLHTSNMVSWLNEEHAHNHLDLIIVNGDLVHDQPELLPELKKEYLDKFSVPYHTLPGNHDHADAKVWKDAFGYEDNYFFEHGNTGFVLANTTDNKGAYVCPNPAFIKASLDQFSDKKIVFVILHVPVVQWLKSEESYFLNCPEIVKLLHSYPNVKAVFHGHDHFLDGVRYTEKLPHFFDSHIGGDWGTDYRGYRVVEVDENNTIYTYQVNASMNPRLNANKI